MTWNEEEMKKLKKENYQAYRKKYLNHKMKDTEWYCDVCKNEKNYTLRNKWSHLKTKKHEKNYYELYPLIKLIKKIKSKTIKLLPDPLKPSKYTPPKPVPKLRTKKIKANSSTKIKSKTSCRES